MQDMIKAVQYTTSSERNLGNEEATATPLFLMELQT